jgi:hypothetical protein
LLIGALHTSPSVASRKAAARSGVGLLGWRRPWKVADLIFSCRRSPPPFAPSSRSGWGNELQ